MKKLLKDKHDNYSMRELVIALAMLLIVASWIANLAFGVATPEHMFYALVSLIATGCFGYSIERPSYTNQPNNTNQIDKEIENECNKN